MDFDPSTAKLTQAPDQGGFDPSTATLTKAPAAATTVYNPTEGMSIGQRMAAGAGKSVVDTSHTLYQLGAAIGHAAGLVSDDKMAQIQQDAAERQHLDQPLVQTTSGKVGYGLGLAGQVLAVPGAAGEVAGAAGDAAALSGAAGRAVAAGAAPLVDAGKAMAGAVAPHLGKIAALSQIAAATAALHHYLSGSESGSPSELVNKVREIKEMVKNLSED